MIYSLENKTKRELVEIVHIQIEEYQLAQKRIAELEKDYENASLALIALVQDASLRKAKEWIEIQNLEQQAKSLEDYAEQENRLKEIYLFNDGEDIQHLNLITGLNSRAKHLRKQAKQLKGSQ